MGKYKVGDKVRVRSWDDMEKEFGTLPSGSIRVEHAFTEDMRKYCGKVVTIAEITTTGYHIKEDYGRWFYSDGMFESLNQSIVIYTKDNKVIAIDKSTGKTAEAFCNPDDKFDFYAGADIAYERLRGRMALRMGPTTKSKYFTGEVICTYGGGYFTKGKIYKIENGVITRDSGVTDRGLKSVEQLNHLYSSQFIKIVK